MVHRRRVLRDGHVRNPEPHLGFLGDEDDFGFARRKEVADDDLVAVPFDRLSRFRDQDCRVGLELEGRIWTVRRRRERRSVCRGERGGGSSYRARLTLKETTKPSLDHSSTIVLSTFGTWSISITREPLPDWILCSDCAHTHAREELVN
jgi:hypothetical protein